MELCKRTEITVDTNEVLIVRRARVYRAWCPSCGKQADMVGLGDARAIAGIPADVIDGSKSAEWHVFEAQEAALVCMDSLLKSIGQR